MTSLTPQTVALVAAIGGAVVPPLTSLLKNEKWSPQVKQLIAGVLSLATAAVALLITDKAAFGMGFASIGALIYAASQGVYGLYFRGSAVETKLAQFGGKTAPPAAP